ncbi:hypothetical protein K431DRAFT_286369 [Polychaeton citri CBS 116435]|uniref:Uncharacterized protein n=1 Tax=Polychaeton citri CBS 116435 TaxID=1314669 RepID=A0A9P4UMR5_9PEZI|nr:hypothetical protein K431DRAFT_286369 [Polychaeton citri CBS 116435]
MQECLHTIQSLCLSLPLDIPATTHLLMSPVPSTRLQAERKQKRGAANPCSGSPMHACIHPCTHAWEAEGTSTQPSAHPAILPTIL